VDNEVTSSSPFCGESDFEPAFRTLQDEIEKEDCAETTSAPFPSLSFLRDVCEDSYRGFTKIDPPWRFLKEVRGKKMSEAAAGISARFFINTATRQLLLVFKGSSNAGDYWTDYYSVYKNQRGIQCDSAATLGAVSRALVERLCGSVQLIITGHSLGGFLAQVAAFAAQNFRLVDGSFCRVDFQVDMDVHPHTVAFDSPPCVEKILSSTLINPISPECLRLDVTNYIIDMTKVNFFDESRRHLGRVIVLKKHGDFKIRGDVNSWCTTYTNHIIAHFSNIETADKCVVIELNNAKTEPLDSSVVPFFAFSQKEYEQLKILPLLRHVHAKVIAQLNYEVYADRIKVSDEEIDSFVPRMRQFLRKNGELLEDHVRQVEDYQSLIIKELWNLTHQDFQDVDLELNEEIIKALTESERDVTIKNDTSFREKMLLARIIINSVANAYFFIYKNYVKLDTKLRNNLLENFSGTLVMVLESNDIYEPAPDKKCKFILLSENLETNCRALKPLEKATIELISPQSKRKLKEKRVSFFSREIAVIELCENLPTDLNLIEIYDFKLAQLECSKPLWDTGFYLEQKVLKININQSHAKEFINPDKLFEESEIKQLVLSAGPGMGKTTFLNHLLKRLPGILPGYWILKINLLDHCDFLSELNERKGKLNNAEKINDAIKFIQRGEDLTSKSQFQRSIFDFLKKVKKLVILIDAFDEICPKYRKTTLRLMSTIKKLQLNFLMSTRPQELELIQGQLRIHDHFELQGIEFHKLPEFFLSYFKIKMSFTETRAKEKAEQLQQILNDSKIMANFWCIPLQATMVAELFAMSDGPRTIDFNNLSELFERFVQQRIDKDLLEKVGMQRTHPKQSSNFNKTKKNIEDCLMLLATKGCFAEFECKTLESLGKRFKKEVNATGIALVGKKFKVTFSHWTFAEYFCAKYCLANMEKPLVLQFLLQILTDKEHGMIRKFLNDMVCNSTQAMVADLVKNSNQEVLIRICKEDLLQLFHFLKRSGVEFEHKQPRQFPSSQDGSLEEIFEENPVKRARIEDEGECDSDFEENDSQKLSFPLGFAIDLASKQMVMDLLEDGADLALLLRDDIEYEKALTRAVFRQMEPLVKKIEQTRMLTSVPNHEKFCVVHMAVEANNADLLRYLIEIGANAKAIDTYGLTPLGLAKQKQNCKPEIVHLLENLDVPIN